MSQKDNERAIMTIEGISDFSLQNLKVLEAFGVIFGEFYDDVQSGEIIVTVKVQAFYGQNLALEKVRFPRGRRLDAENREKTMKELAEKICSSLSSIDGTTPSPFPMATPIAIEKEIPISAPLPTPTVSRKNECDFVKVDDIAMEFYSVTHKPWSNGWKGWRWVVAGVTHAQRDNAKQILVYQKLSTGQISLWRFDVAKTDLLQTTLPDEYEFNITFGSCWKKVRENTGSQMDIDARGNEHGIKEEKFYILQD
jgi:hypothetical protein